VNLDIILPVLYQKGVLSSEDVNSLVNIRTVSGGSRSYQVLHFVTILNKKGKRGFDRVVEALREDKEHMGHEELAEILSQKQSEWVWLLGVALLWMCVVYTAHLDSGGLFQN